MIALYLRWSGEPLPSPLADRLAASLGLGSNAAGVRSVDGATLACTVRDKVRARSWMPQRTPHGGHVVLLGHIDNRAELLRNLPANQSDQVDPACDDAALYGHCHAAWGVEAERRIVGQYAAIVWLPGQQVVHAARSPIQAPALHVWRDAERLIIATTARALFATGEVERRVDEQKLADSLYLNYMDGERGWFAGVERLPIGCRARFTPDKVAIDRWYDPADLPDVRLSQDEDYVEAANALFEDGTRAALNGFSRPAVSVSGGFDSQAVAASAMGVLGPDVPLHGFTSVPEDGWDGRTHPGRFGDEREHVAALAAMYPSFVSHLVDAAGLPFDHQLDAMFLLAGAPPRNAMNLHWIHEVRRQARAAGCDVVLTGAMGNATFSFDGNGYLPTLLRQGHWRTLVREVRPLAARLGVSVPRALVSHALLPHLPYGPYAAIMRWRHGAVPKEEQAWCPMNPDYAAEMHVAERAADMGFDAQFRAKTTTRDYRAGMLRGAINEGGDIQAAFAHIWGIPSRDPTSYRPLVEYCLGIPDDQYWRNGTRRWLARRMFAGRLPAMVLDERRRGVQGADWHLRLGRQREALAAEIDRLATDPAMAHRFNLRRMRKLLDNWPAETPIEDAEAGQGLQMALTRAIATARYIRYVEGRND
ncbi:MAG: asparagine synthetase B family protein [Alteraurantiacibacter sp.]